MVHDGSARQLRYILFQAQINTSNITAAAGTGVVDMVYSTTPLSLLAIPPPLPSPTRVSGVRRTHLDHVMPQVEAVPTVIVISGFQDPSCFRKAGSTSAKMTHPGTKRVGIPEALRHCWGILNNSVDVTSGLIRVMRYSLARPVSVYL